MLWCVRGPVSTLTDLHDPRPPGPRRWWAEYADRKNDETDEYVANSLLYDRNHLPRSAPAPDCVSRPSVLASVAADVVPSVAALPQPVSEVGLQQGRDLEPQLPASAAVLVPSKRTLEQN